jgi:hypothetical protein
MRAQGLICRNACWIEHQLGDDPIEWTNEEASRAKPISQRASHHRSNRRLAQDLCDAGRGADLKVPPREVALDASTGESPVVVYDPSGPGAAPASGDSPLGIALAIEPVGRQAIAQAI